MKKKDTYWREYNIQTVYVTNCSKLFGIIHDSDRIEGQELLWGVKMTNLGSVYIRCNILLNDLIQEMNNAVKNTIQ